MVRGGAAGRYSTHRRRRLPDKPQRLVLRPITATGNNKTLPGTVLLRHNQGSVSLDQGQDRFFHFRPVGALNGRPVLPWARKTERPTHRDGAWLQDLFYLLLITLCICTPALIWRTSSPYRPRRELPDVSAIAAMRRRPSRQDRSPPGSTPYASRSCTPRSCAPRSCTPRFCTPRSCTPKRDPRHLLPMVLRQSACRDRRGRDLPWQSRRGWPICGRIGTFPSGPLVT